MRIVPSQQLILVVGCLMPVALLAAFRPEWSNLWVLALAVIGMMALVDALVSAQRLANVRIEADPVTRLARDTDGTLTLHIRSEGDVPKTLTVGLPLPVEFIQERETLRIELKEDATHWSIDWELRARARGVYACPDLYLEAASMLGLFAVRRRYASSSEIRVYPNLRRERRQLANLFLNRGQIGVHAQRMVGQGREYEQLRDYSFGDSMLDIHWKASAKRGELVTKTYQVERTQEIYLIIDHSRLSGLRSTSDDRSVDDDYAETILERYVTAASVLGMVAEREGDRFGLVAYGQRVSRFVRANGGKQHGQVVQDALFDLKTERGPADFDELFTFLRTRLRRRALLVFLTDLSDAACSEEFQKRVPMIASQHYVLVNSIRREGVQALYADDEAPASLAEQIAGHMRWEQLRQMQSELRSQGVELTLVDDEKLSLDIVNQYLAVKQRQVL